MENRNFINKKDIIIIVALVIICALFVFIPNFFKKQTTNPVAVLTIDNVICEKYNLVNTSLNENEFIDISLKEKYGKDIILRFYNGSVEFISSSCPDKICIKAGKLKNIGDRAACLPNKTALIIYDYDEAKNII